MPKNKPHFFTDDNNPQFSKKTLYLLDHKIKWSVFKLLQDKLVKDDGPVPVKGDKAIWQLLKEKKIYCWFAEDLPNDLGIGLTIHKKYDNWNKVLISNPKKNEELYQ
jgi:hypothetical protein